MLVESDEEGCSAETMARREAKAMAMERKRASATISGTIEEDLGIFVWVGWELTMLKVGKNVKRPVGRGGEMMIQY